MSDGKGIHLNGDKLWLEQFLNEKFGRIEDKMEVFGKQIDIHRIAIQEINKNHDECREGIQQQIWTLLGKEQGLNVAHQKETQTKDFNFKKYAIGLTLITIGLNILFFFLGG